MEFISKTLQFKNSSICHHKSHSDFFAVSQLNQRANRSMNHSIFKFETEFQTLSNCINMLTQIQIQLILFQFALKQTL